MQPGSGSCSTVQDLRISNLIGSGFVHYSNMSAVGYNATIQTAGGTFQDSGYGSELVEDKDINGFDVGDGHPTGYSFHNFIDNLNQSYGVTPI